MDRDYLRKCLKKIRVRNLINADVEVVNKSPLPMMGKGRQGAVFKVTEDVCVKVFGNPEDCDRECYALTLGQHTNLFPKIYDKGPLHIAMEIIRGVDLREYLQSQPLTKELSIKLIEMLIIFKEIGFERIDHHKRQIYVQADGSLKVIDVARTVWRDRVYPYPRKLLNSLGDENKQLFLTHVQELAPELYQEWLDYMQMEEMSREIYRVMLDTPSEKVNIVKTLSKKLKTTEDEKRYLVLLEGLMHKVFKEEWIKTMLARGEDLEEIKTEIDEYWDLRKQEYESDGLNKSKNKNTKPKKNTKGNKAKSAAETRKKQKESEVRKKQKESEVRKKQKERKATKKEKDRRNEKGKTEKRKTEKKKKDKKS
ncbi:hypothetical protein [Bacillus sp. B15-48]|uniref:hypothetical protein n=1 Tax=Bacillus sp. B15-48 TaxID=1548601 RepID=UPI00193F06C4|nr:hypothetical protein [Bacillus sp. B15-48]MBM4761143.1 hypothetical protein [Bacillus sp. B15-48]